LFRKSLDESATICIHAAGYHFIKYDSDIQNSTDKIIGIALKYGYESPATFTRAFRELHGTMPTGLR